MGLLPIQATEAGVKRAAVFDPVTGKRKRFVNNQRVVSEEQVEPDLLVYCNVDTRKCRGSLKMWGISQVDCCIQKHQNCV